ncbi:hypothetical protein Vadar_004716 [Vaccinium darrowii]|uniref:Uncharacterized protein n=1 Tax=Vaccinium darrowii TaxID=229202 RepID=A0ACB7YJD7_9ERIC|nr:hypothetical protein Vadar_004716 [Vaccinium darrowii]
MMNLEVQMDELQVLRRTIEGQIEEAKTRGEVIMDDVLAWLNEADVLRQGVMKFGHDKIDNENIQCFKFSCPAFISRYRLGKQAKKKVGDVKSLLEKAPFGRAYLSFDSRELVFNRIMEALTDSNVNVVGVYGTGGVGKTTTVEKVGKQVKKDGLFDEVVMAVVSQVANVVKIQGLLADRLGLKLEAETEAGRAIKLWHRLNNGKRNLVILDDIWKKMNLKEIGIPISDGKKGCKVILTSRNQHVLKNMQVDKDFQIQVLPEQEAWNLFKKKINDVDFHDPLHDIAKVVCRECRGLPLAILAVGAALKGKSMSAWKSSLDKLEKSMLNTIEDIDPNLFTSLRLSYDYLESTVAKSCFLLCCLFPEDAQVPIEALARHCMARRLLGQKPETLNEAIDIVCSVVDTLKTSCLLLDGKNDDFVKMHDVIRDVAILIAKEEEAYLVKHGVQEWPETGSYEKYSAISLRSETIHELPDELVRPGLHTLMLECSSSNVLREPSTKIPRKFFRGTEKLMVLELNRVIVLPLPYSLGKLTELRMLCLNDCKLGDIAILKDLKNNLEVLSLRGSDIKALPPELGELTRLQLLDLGDCEELEVIPNGVIPKLHRLEELHFPVSFNNWKGTTANEEISKVSLEELMSLTRLSTLSICIPFLRLLPEDLGFLNLSRFFIIVGSHRSVYSGFPLERVRFSSTSVVMNGVNYKNDGLIDFSILERLLGKPKWDIERPGLYPSRSFSNLTELVLLHCELKYLLSPSYARRLSQLQRLVIRDCGTMEAVIGNFGNEEENDEEIITNVINFSQLTTLELNGLPRLISFYPRIKKATATESHSFAPAQSLFNEKVTFPRLQNLELDGCESLRCIFQLSMARVLVNLQQLIIKDCSKMEAVVDGEEIDEGQGRKSTNKTLFPHLSKLKLCHLSELRWFCHFRYPLELPLLSQMVIEVCPRLNSFSSASVSSSAHAQMVLFIDKDSPMLRRSYWGAIGEMLLYSKVISAY